jgi:hypothetical protein
MTDFENPEFFLAQGENDAPVADSESPQALGGMGQGFGEVLRVIDELVFDGRTDSFSDRRIKPRQIPIDDVSMVSKSISTHDSG